MRIFKTNKQNIKFRQQERKFIDNSKLSLMGMGSPYQKKKIIRFDTILTNFKGFAVRLDFFSLK